MTLGELRSLLRSRLDDTSLPQLWGDAELNGYLNQAVNEACVRAQLNLDSTTPEVTVIPVTAGVYEYPVHSSVYHIESVWDEGRNRLLVRSGAEEREFRQPGWRTERGEPLRYMLDLHYYHVPGDTEHSHRLRIHPIPEHGTTIKLSVLRLPLYGMESDADEPEIPVHLQPELLHWACHLAYLKRDADTEDVGRSDLFAQRFAEAVGAKRNAREVEFRRKAYPRRVTAQWL